MTIIASSEDFFFHKSLVSEGYEVESMVIRIFYSQQKSLKGTKMKYLI